ncbi:DUF2752 domain-containing protein [Cellulomonas massiliensis]|uniref:DUF2752 domain-containing protein n=1 Tax=Cellulomonas massiliensis TaxID=1465811 RepID=UPI0002FBB23A|nr:DUF2752 domain-containing protein [Cellulomonas massiliensis]
MQRRDARAAGDRAAWWTPPATVAAAVAGALALVAVRDPHRPGSWGLCPSLALTGWACPACGGLRATWDLLHGDVAGAWASNPLWVALVPLVVAAWLAWAVRRRAGRPVRVPPVLGVVLLAVTVVFGLLRNLPATGGVLGP